MQHIYIYVYIYMYIYILYIYIYYIYILYIFAIGQGIVDTHGSPTFNFTSLKSLVTRSASWKANGTTL